jgi:DNA invertase Pin-like site-specific DNA recombinase
MKIGYLRVSTKEQCEDRQRDALLPICDELHVEKLSSVAKVRPVYERVVANLKPGDTFVVWDLDRAWRSAKDALNELHNMRARGVEVQIASMSLDTTTPIGKLMFTFISGLAEFERELHVTRTKQGLESARKRGKRIGRPPKVTNEQIRGAQQKLANGSATVGELAALNGVHPWTLRRRISEMKDKNSKSKIVE